MFTEAAFSFHSLPKTKNKPKEKKKTNKEGAPQNCRFPFFMSTEAAFSFDSLRP